MLRRTVSLVFIVSILLRSFLASSALLARLRFKLPVAQPAVKARNPCKLPLFDNIVKRFEVAY
jgi:hypothetical protein